MNAAADRDVVRGVLRGVALPTASTLGHSPTSTLGPTGEHGFRSGGLDHLRALADAGVEDVRITLDWPRLQPRPGHLDGDWSEWFDALLRAGGSWGIRPWACLHDGGEPRWFDDLGGFADAETVGRWWPRWVEAAADRFGDALAGWIPTVATPPHHRATWRDTWSALRGGPPVAAVVSLPADRGALDHALALECDLFGVALTADPSPERVGEILRLAADEGPERPMVLADVGVEGLEPSARADALGATREAADDARRDGIDLRLAFAECPLDEHGQLTADGRAWLA